MLLLLKIMFSKNNFTVGFFYDFCCSFNFPYKIFYLCFAGSWSLSPVSMQKIQKSAVSKNVKKFLFIAILQFKTCLEDKKKFFEIKLKFFLCTSKNANTRQ